MIYSGVSREMTPKWLYVWLWSPARVIMFEGHLHLALPHVDFDFVKCLLCGPQAQPDGYIPSLATLRRGYGQALFWSASKANR